MYIAVPAAAVVLVAITSTGSFRSWERFMYVFIVANFLAIPLLVLVHPNIGTMVHDSFVPSIEGGANSTAVLLIIAIVGTTVAPWQLFFQQSNIIDKRITPRWINYERADTVIGAFVVVIAAGALMGDRRLRLRRHPAGRPLHRRRWRGRGAQALRQPVGRDVLRHRPAQRLADRRRVGYARDLVRLR